MKGETKSRIEFDAICSFIDYIVNSITQASVPCEHAHFGVGSIGRLMSNKASFFNAKLPKIQSSLEVVDFSVLACYKIHEMPAQASVLYGYAHFGAVGKRRPYAE